MRAEQQRGFEIVVVPKEEGFTTVCIWLCAGSLPEQSGLCRHRGDKQRASFVCRRTSALLTAILSCFNLRPPSWERQRQQRTIRSVDPRSSTLRPHSCLVIARSPTVFHFPIIDPYQSNYRHAICEVCPSQSRIRPKQQIYCRDCPGTRARQGTAQASAPDRPLKLSHPAESERVGFLTRAGWRAAERYSARERARQRDYIVSACKPEKLLAHVSVKANDSAVFAAREERHARHAHRGSDTSILLTFDLISGASILLSQRPHTNTSRENTTTDLQS